MPFRACYFLGRDSVGKTDGYLIAFQAGGCLMNQFFAFLFNDIDNINIRDTPCLSTGLVIKWMLFYNIITDVICDETILCVSV